jgi:hypothetical protein
MRLRQLRQPLFTLCLPAGKIHARCLLPRILVLLHRVRLNELLNASTSCISDGFLSVPFMRDQCIRVLRDDYPLVLRVSSLRGRRRQLLTMSSASTLQFPFDTSVSPLTLLICAVSLCIAVYLAATSKKPKQGLRWAPSPPGWPIVGNLPDIIKAAGADRMHLQMQEWAKTYGPVVKVSAGTIDVSSSGWCGIRC